MKSQRQQQLEAYLAEDPHDPFIHYALGLELVKSGLQNEGLTKLEWLLTAHPDYLATYYQLGKLYETAGKEKEAIAVYKKGMTLAELQKNKHTFNELKSALEDLEE